MSTAEAEINPDGSTNVPPVDPPMSDSSDNGSSEKFNTAGDAGTEEPFTGYEIPEETVASTDPAIYLALAILLVGIIAMVVVWMRRKKNKSGSADDFFENLDGDKFNLQLPAAVDEYYQIREKCEEQGWVPGKPPANPQAQQNGPHRVMAQALMKRCIADIPLVTHVQKESTGMNKLYSQSMCSVKQWRSYQAAEAMVSGEVDEVRAEADEIEPGWSGVIWRQAMQYHQMLKQRHEMEAKSAAQQKEKEVAEAAKTKAIKDKVDAERRKIALAEKTAQDLIKQEEREAQSKKSFNGAGMKKGFLSNNNKKK
uniref:Uncharacterized protein n=2 Tax=Proboscia inermis TaxID=420281 RepID=A0A7S0CEG2_9STRA|mmetsp:Transcript_4012/g.4140  ORF Transcript_4012/g.4140 Transcript_4012/m.4140 type:complete len:311 (+) Transcript_4012:164-1096(+)